MANSNGNFNVKATPPTRKRGHGDVGRTPAHNLGQISGLTLIEQMEDYLKKPVVCITREEKIAQYNESFELSRIFGIKRLPKFLEKNE